MRPEQSMPHLKPSLSLRPSAKAQTSLSRQAKQQGAGLVAAIFITVIMAILIVGMTQFLVSGQQSYGYEILSTRAFLAAESGAEITMQEALANPTVCTANAVRNLANNCLANTSCVTFNINGTDYYNIRSQGVCGANNDQAIRQLTVRIQN